jgi:class 3 adenylate cyclase
MASIIFLDIRNFSAHRRLLARTGSGRPLTLLVKRLLEDAVSTAKASMKRFHISDYPLLNHTGDGFVLVLEGGSCCLAALNVASQLRELADTRIDAYHKALKRWSKQKHESIDSLKPLAYGMGIHCGGVTNFKYKSFSGERRAFLGSAVNVASRVEGCTKDHPYPVLCTEYVLKKARLEVSKAKKLAFEGFFESIGLHNLRGLEAPIELIRCDPELHRMF